MSQKEVRAGFEDSLASGVNNQSLTWDGGCLIVLLTLPLRQVSESHFISIEVWMFRLSVALA